MKKFLPFLIALFAGIAQGYSLAPANEWLQLAALAVLFFIFAGLRTAKAGFLAGLFFGIGWFVTSLAWLYVSVHDYGYQPPVFAAFVVFIFSCYLALYPAAVGAPCAWSMNSGSSAGHMFLAIAQAAWLNQIPFVIIRAISDKADGSAQMDYSEFEAKAIEHTVKLVEAAAAKLA